MIGFEKVAMVLLTTGAHTSEWGGLTPKIYRKGVE